jgi:hypothetical protein
MRFVFGARHAATVVTRHLAAARAGQPAMAVAAGR